MLYTELLTMRPKQYRNDYCRKLPLLRTCNSHGTLEGHKREMIIHREQHTLFITVIAIVSVLMVTAGIIGVEAVCVHGGSWLNSLYSSLSEFLRDRCEAWLLLQPADGLKILENVLPCPPTANQTHFYGAFREDTVLIWLFHPGADTCFRQMRLTSESGNQCCYDSKGKLMVGPPGGGTVDRFAPVDIVSIIQHFTDDVLPAVYCCRGRFADCSLYHRKRPSDDGKRFNPPNPV